MEPALENIAGDAAFEARSHTGGYWQQCMSALVRCRDKAAHLDAKFLWRFHFVTA